jgi:hypothetical protein
MPQNAVVLFSERETKTAVDFSQGHLELLQ